MNIFACISYTLRSRFRHIDFKVGSGFQFVASPWACSVFLLHLWVLESILRKTDKGKLVPQRLETRAILRWWRCLVSLPRNIQLKMKYFADYCRHQQDVHGLSQCVFFLVLKHIHHFCCGSKDSPLYLFETKMDDHLTCLNSIFDLNSVRGSNDARTQVPWGTCWMTLRCRIYFPMIGL